MLPLQMRPFLPARDFAASQAFYRDLGFTLTPLGEDVVELRLGAFTALLQNYHVQAWAENAMMHMAVPDLDAWWRHVQALDLPARHAVRAPTPPELQPWGLRVLFLHDPCGVLWHISDAPDAASDE